MRPDAVPLNPQSKLVAGLVRALHGQFRDPDSDEVIGPPDETTLWAVENQFGVITKKGWMDWDAGLDSVVSLVIDLDSGSVRSFYKELWIGSAPLTWGEGQAAVECIWHAGGGLDLVFHCLKADLARLTGGE